MASGWRQDAAMPVGEWVFPNVTGTLLKNVACVSVAPQRSFSIRLVRKSS